MLIHIPCSHGGFLRKGICLTACARSTSSVSHGASCVRTLRKSRGHKRILSSLKLGLGATWRLHFRVRPTQITPSTPLSTGGFRTPPHSALVGKLRPLWATIRRQYSPLVSEKNKFELSSSTSISTSTASPHLDHNYGPCWQDHHLLPGTVKAIAVGDH